MQVFIQIDACDAGWAAWRCGRRHLLPTRDDSTASKQEVLVNSTEEAMAYDAVVEPSRAVSGGVIRAIISVTPCGITKMNGKG